MSVKLGLWDGGRHGRMRTSTLAVVLAAASLTLGTTAAEARPTDGRVASAGSAQSEGDRKVPLRSTGMSLSVTPSGRQCDAPLPGEILIPPIRSESKFGITPGDTLKAIGVDDACFYVRQDETIRVYGDGVFTGTIAGCGTGTLGFQFTAEISEPDPVTQIRTSRDIGLIKPFSGTGGLATVSRGSYTAQTRVVGGESVVGDLIGAVKC